MQTASQELSIGWTSEASLLQQQMVSILERLSALGLESSCTLQLDECIVFQRRALAAIESAIATDGNSDWMASIDWKALGLRLSTKRMEAKMQQKELASRLDVSTQTIRNLETAEKRPSQQLLLKLLDILELNLTIGDLIGEKNSANLTLTSWLAPQYDPNKMLEDLVTNLNGTGDTLEQSTAYLDPRSAADWLDFSLSHGILTRTAPLQEAARLVTKNAGRGSFEVCCLGSGDARKESTFVDYCAELLSKPNRIRMYLLDISHSLLTEGYNHSKTTLAKHRLSVIALHGNFHDLSRYPLFDHNPAAHGGSRVITMLGNTLANLDNEVRFFRDTLSGCSPGDYFLADFSVAPVNSDDPEVIKQKDPVLGVPISQARVNWLGGPLRRYCRDLRDIEWSMELDTNCTVRGSYEYLYVAKVASVGKPSRRFVVFRCKVYEPSTLISCLSDLGWQCEFSAQYAESERSRSVLILLRKQ